MIEDLYDKVTVILARQSALKKRLNAQNSESAAGALSGKLKKS